MPASGGSRIVVAVVCLVGLCATGLGGCSGMEAADDPVPARPVPGGRLVYGLESDPNGLDPTRNAWDNSGLQLANALYDPLAAFDTEGRARPYLAEAFEPSADLRTWVVRLRPGVRFSDGEPFDAPALVTYLQALQVSAITGPAARYLTGTRVVDPLAVEVSLSRPWATLPALVAAQGGYVVAPRQLTDPDGTSKPVGTGPFMLRRWEQDRRFELVRNPRYWRAGLPYLDAVDFEVVPDGHERIEMVGRGRLDVASVSSPWDVRHLEEATAEGGPLATVKVERDTGDAEKTAIAFNTSRPPLDDVRVRRAIAFATDVPALAEANDWPLERIARSPFDPASPFYTAVDYPPHDVAAARALLQEYLDDPAVSPVRQRITFELLAPDDGAEFVSQLIAQWAEAGIDARLRVVDLKQVTRLAVLGDYDATILRYFAATDPDVLWHFFVAETIDPSGLSLNFTRLANERITSGMNAARASLDPGVRKRAYTEVQQAFADQLPFVWLQRWEWRVATAPGVRDARNVTLPDGTPAMPLVAGTHRLTETWMAH